MDRMIQDIFPSRYQVAYQPRPPKPEDKCFFFRGRTVLERWDGEALVLPDYAAVAAYIGQPQFLFIIDETAYYLAEYHNALESPEGYEWHDLRHERSKKSRVLCFAEATAYHLAEWYGANPPRGEFVLVVEGAAGTAAEAPTLAGGLARVEALRAEGLSLRDAVRQAARETGLAKNELYDRAVGKTGGC